ERDGRIALYLTDKLPLLAPPLSTQHSALLDYLAAPRASFFAQISDAVGGFPNEVADALWNLVWTGLVTNDTFHALRAFTRAHAPRRRQRRSEPTAFRSRRLAPPSAEGRWTLVARTTGARPGAKSPARQEITAWATAWA